MLQVRAEATVPWLLLSRRGQAILLTSNPRRGTARPIATASKHLTHGLVVEVHVEVCGHLPPFSYIQQSQRHVEGFDLVEQSLSHSQFIYRQNSAHLTCFAMYFIYMNECQSLFCSIASVKSKSLKSSHW